MFRFIIQHEPGKMFSFKASLINTKVKATKNSTIKPYQIVEENNAEKTITIPKSSVKVKNIINIHLIIKLFHIILIDKIF